jgi:hypothetical protein
VSKANTLIPCIVTPQPTRTRAAGTMKLLTISLSRSSSLLWSDSRKAWIAAPVAVSFQNQSPSWRLDGLAAPLRQVLAEVRRSGRLGGGKLLSRGALYLMLQNHRSCSITSTRRPAAHIRQRPQQLGRGNGVGNTRNLDRRARPEPTTLLKCTGSTTRSNRPVRRW